MIQLTCLASSEKYTWSRTIFGAYRIASLVMLVHAHRCPGPDALQGQLKHRLVEDSTCRLGPFDAMGRLAGLTYTLYILYSVY